MSKGVWVRVPLLAPKGVSDMRDVRYIEDVNIGDTFYHLTDTCMKTNFQMKDSYLVVSLNSGLCFYLFKNVIVELTQK